MKKRIRISREDRIYYAIIGVALALVSLIILYPLIYIVSSSFSSARAIMAGQVWFLPVDLTAEGYHSVITYPGIVQGYLNSFLYMISGTMVNIVITLFCAFGLSFSDMPGRRWLTFLFTFTMLFSGGMIPNYLLIKNLHMINTIWAMILPGAMSVYNMIITRTFIQNNIPKDLREASEIDGCSYTRYFLAIVLPLSKAVIAVITLYYAVAHWNSYFNAFLYLSKRPLFPLQLVLREILVLNDVTYDVVTDPEQLFDRLCRAKPCTLECTC